MNDSITYYIKKDETGFAEGNKQYFIRAGYPINYLTDNTNKREINKIAKFMRQLGFTVVDLTK